MIDKRTRFFLAVEGECERAFAKWLQVLSDQTLHVHLDNHVLYGGGYKTMLEGAVRLYKIGVATKGAYKDRFLIVDSDRADDADWSVEKLRQEAGKHGFSLCLQKPNYEAVLYRMLPGKQNAAIHAAEAADMLKSAWPAYTKSIDARTLMQRYKLDDLLRMASCDPDFRTLLEKIGLLKA